MIANRDGTGRDGTNREGRGERRRGSGRGHTVAKTGPEWWADRWRRWLGELKLDSTRSSANGSRIKRLEVGLGVVSAVIQDRNQSICKLTLRIEPWCDAEWARVVTSIGSQPQLTSQISAGELPTEVDNLLADGGVPLLPVSAQALQIECDGSGCPEGNCHYAALVLAQLGEALVDDPWMLFRMRGRDQTQLLTALRKPRPQNAESAPSAASSTAPVPGSRFHRNPGEATSQEDVPPLREQMAHYWGVSKAVDGYRPHLQEPKVEAVLLRRLGPLPGTEAEDDVFDELAAVYRRVTREALRRAFAADGDPEK